MLIRLHQLRDVKEGRSREDAFSLLELVMGVVILGILFAISYNVYSNQMKEAVLATLKSDVTQTAGQVSNATGKANQNQTYTFNPCTPAATFNSKMRIQSDTKNVITCVYYGETSTTTSAQKERAYNNYAWCVQGRRTADINATWNYNSKTQRLTEGACTRPAATSNAEAIG